MNQKSNSPTTSTTITRNRAICSQLPRSESSSVSEGIPSFEVATAAPVAKVSTIVAPKVSAFVAAKVSIIAIIRVSVGGTVSSVGKGAVSKSWSVSLEGPVKYLFFMSTTASSQYCFGLARMVGQGVCPSMKMRLCNT